MVKNSDFNFRNNETVTLELPFSEHIEELRQRLFHILCLILILTFIAFIEVKILVKILELPVENVKFFQLSPGEYFISTVKISFYTVLLFGSPFATGQIILFLLPGLTNITIAVEKQSDEVKFQSDFIAAFDFNLQFNRTIQRQINYKFPLGRNIAYPIIGSVGFGLIVKENLTGSFFNSLNRNTEYNITVDFPKSTNDTLNTKMIFSGCRFSNIQYSSAINSFKIANLRFNFEQDLSPGLRGLFWSGNTEYGIISNVPVSW